MRLRTRVVGWCEAQRQWSQIEEGRLLAVKAVLAVVVASSDNGAGTAQVALPQRAAAGG